jgi:hypothetical protein
LGQHWLRDDLFLKYLALKPADPCLCGSGKRFADCHMLPRELGQIPIWKVRSALRKLYKRKGCFFADVNCSSVFSASHSISRKHVAQIADAGHVLRFTPADSPKEWAAMAEGNTEPQLVGINEVSTFYGFCSVHDDQIFAPLEKISIIPDPRQAALLLFRSLCREYYVKSEVVKLVPTTQEIVNTKADPKYRELLNAYSIQNYLGQFRSLEDLFKDFQAVCQDVRNGQYTNYQTLTYVFDRVLPLACSSYVNPPLDLEGRLFQDYNDLSKDTESFSFNMFSQDGKGYVCFSWYATKFKDFFAFMNTIDESRIADFLVQFLFAFSENHAFSPVWWKGLSDLKKRRLKRIFFPDVINPEIATNPVDSFRYSGFVEAQLKEVTKDFEAG